MNLEKFKNLSATISHPIKTVDEILHAIQEKIRFKKAEAKATFAVNKITSLYMAAIDLQNEDQAIDELVKNISPVVPMKKKLMEQSIRNAFKQFPDDAEREAYVFFLLIEKSCPFLLEKYGSPENGNDILKLGLFNAMTHLVNSRSCVNKLTRKQEKFINMRINRLHSKLQG